MAELVASCAYALVSEDEALSSAPLAPTSPKNGLKMKGKGGNVGKSAAPTEPDEKPLGLEIREIVHQIENLEEADTKSRLIELDLRRERGKFELGGLLSHVHDNPAWYGGGGFRKWVDFNTNIKGSTAQGLIQVYHAVINLGDAGDELKVRDWTKVRHFATLLTKENASDWAAFAANNSKSAVIERARAERAKAKGATVEKKTFRRFVLHEGQREVVETAIERAKKFAETDVDSMALEYICSDYLAGTSPVKSLAHLGPDALTERLVELFGLLKPDNAEKVFEAIASKLARKIQTPV